MQTTTTSRQQASLENTILRMPTLQLQLTTLSTEQPTPVEPRTTYMGEIYHLPTTSSKYKTTKAETSTLDEIFHQETTENTAFTASLTTTTEEILFQATKVSPQR